MGALEDALRRGVAPWLQPPLPPAKDSAARKRGAAAVELPPETLPKAGAITFDYSGTNIIQTGPPVVLVAFRVPDQLSGIITGLAAGSYTPVDNDELTIELVINSNPMFGELAANNAAPLLSIPTISGDVDRPTELFQPIYSGDLVTVEARLAGVGQLLPIGTFPANIRPVRARMVGRFWPKGQGAQEL